MRIGVTLPSFSNDAHAVLAAAEAAEAAGLHGVFSFDHLWPMGQPERPALSAFPTLAAVAAATSRIHLGTLVARISLLPDELLVASMLGLRAIAGDRLIAGLGTGDQKSADEHRRYGLAYLGATARRESLAQVAAQLTDAGVHCWIGAGRRDVNETARAAGLTLNFWGVAPEKIRQESQGGPTTWAGPLPKVVDEAAATLRQLEEAGSSWVVWGWPSSLSAVVEAAAAAGIALAGD